MSTTITHTEAGTSTDTIDHEARAAELVRISEEAIAKPDDAALDEFFSRDFVWHGPGGDLDRDGLKGLFAAMRAAFTDFAVTREQILSTDNWIAARTRMTGVFEHEYTASPVGTLQPNGKPVDLRIHNFFRYDDEGRVAEEWIQMDTLGMLQQLGVDVP